MNDIGHEASRFLVRELQAIQREIEMFPEDESVWRTVPGVTNSAGNLALHLAGNLQHFVGAMLGGTGYVRDREAEFSRRSGTRTEVSAEIQRAIAAVERVLIRFPPDRLDGDFPNPPLGLKIPTGRFLIHLCTHAAFHLGQIGYLRRILTGENRSSGAVSLQPLAS